MSTETTKRKQHSLEVVRKALVALAVTGSSERARELTGVPADTIRDWKNYQHPELYESIRKEVVPQVGERLAQDAEEVIRTFISVAHKSAQKLQDKLEADEDISAVDLSTIGRNASVSGSVFNDKIVGPNRGRPTAIVEHRSSDAFIREHKQFVLDATAEEEPTGSEYMPYPQPSHSPGHKLTPESNAANAHAQLEAGD